MRSFFKVLICLLICVSFCLTFVSCSNVKVRNSISEKHDAYKSDDKEITYTPGTRTEFAYDSEWAGIHYELPEGYNMLSDEETWEMMGFGSEVSFGDDSEKVLEYMKNSDNVIEFMATNSIGCSVTAIAEKTSLNSRQYADKLASDFDNVKINSITYKVGEPVDFEINEIKFIRLDVEAYYVSMDYTAYQTYLVKEVDGARKFVMIFSSILPLNDIYIENIAPYGKRLPDNDTEIENDGNVNIEPKEEPEESAEITEEVTEDEPYDTGIVMSDNIWDFTIKIDGTVYKIPSKLDDFKNSGWTYTYNNNPENKDVYGEGYEAATMENENGKMSIGVINMSGNTKKFGDCKIGSIEILYNKYANHTVELSNGLVITSETTKQDIIEKWGEPDENYEIRIEYKLDTYNLYSFMFKETGEISSIDVDNHVADESDITENGERPDYLDKYVAPTELSDDVFSFMFGFDGDFYALPVPVSEFVNNGWTVAQSVDSVAAKQTVSGGLRMVKGEAEIRLEIRNYEDYQVSPLDCMVTRIYVTDSDYNDNKGFVMAGGITFGMTEQEVFSIIGENGFEKTEYSTGSKEYSYDFGNEYYLKTFYLYFNPEGKLDGINYGYCPLEY